MENGESGPHAVICVWSLFVICDEICDQTGLQCHERSSCLWNWRTVGRRDLHKALHKHHVSVQLVNELLHNAHLKLL